MQLAGLRNTAPRLLSAAGGPAGRWAPAAHALIAFVLANALLVVVMRFNGTPVFEDRSYLRYDSGHYVSIATGGYELIPCDPALYGPGRWCGNAAWFPGYPYLMNLLRPYTGRHASVAGILISKAFLLGTLLVLAYGVREFFGARHAFGVVLAASVFPGAIYYHVVFPMSQFLFFSSLHMVLLLKRRDLLAGVAGAIAALTYSSGYTLAAVSGVYLLLTFESFPILIRRSLLVPGLTLLGVGAVLLIHYHTLGVWNAWFLVQSKYGWEPARPLWAFREILRPWDKNGPDTVVAVQNLAVAGVMLAALVDAAMRRAWNAASTLFLVYACVFFFVPVLLVGPRLGYYRTFSLLMPAALLAARWPASVVTAMVGVFAFLFGLVSVLFFNSAIV